MSTPLVSVVVPIYGVEKYIEEFAVSLFNTTYRNIEVIFVDDASPDESIAILEKLIEKYQPEFAIKILRLEKNGGVGNARQKGNEQATGKYLIHFDPDDKIDPTILSELVQEAEDKNSDVTVCGCSRWSNDGVVAMEHRSYQTPHQFLKELIQGNEQGYLVNKLVKRDLYVDNDIKFVPGINLGEDFSVILRILLVAKSISFVNKRLYYYRLYDLASYPKKPISVHQEGLYNLVKLANDSFLKKCSYRPFYELFRKSFMVNLLSDVAKTGDLKKHKKFRYLFSEVRFADIFNHKKLTIPQKIGTFLLKARLYWLLRYVRMLKKR